MHLPDEDETCTMGAEGESRHAYYFAAHYADLKHSIKPLTSGIRLAATYSLCWKGSGTAPSLDRVISKLDPFVRVVRMYDGTEELIPLTHQYTESAITSRGLAALEGSDAQFAEQLQKAQASTGATEKPFDLFLMLWERRAYMYGGFWGRRGTTSDAEWELQKSETTCQTFDVHGTQLGCNFSPPEDLSNFPGEDMDVEPYSANVGATKTTVYRHSFLVITPRKVGLEDRMRRRGIEATINDTLDLIEQPSCSFLCYQEITKRRDCTRLVGEIC